MSRRRTVAIPLFLLLTWPAWGVAQELPVIGGNFTKAQIEELRKKAAEGDAARKVLDDDKPITIAVGQFFAFKYGNQNHLWLWSDDSLCERLTIPAGQGFTLWGSVVGDAPDAKPLHNYQPRPDAWGFLVGVKEGTATITVVSNGEGGGPPVVLKRYAVQVGPKKPGPDPTPPGPTPGPTPIPLQGLRVLVVYESADMTKMPAAQLTALRAQEVRDYLNSHCAKAGNQPEWRMYDKDADTTHDSDVWKEAMKRPRQSLPWILISDGTKGFEGPLPANKDDLLKLLKQYGGQ